MQTGDEVLMQLRVRWDSWVHASKSSDTSGEVALTEEEWAAMPTGWLLEFKAFLATQCKGSNSFHAQMEQRG